MANRAKVYICRFYTVMKFLFEIMPLYDTDLQDIIKNAKYTPSKRKQNCLTGSNVPKIVPIPILVTA